MFVKLARCHHLQALHRTEYPQVSPGFWEAKFVSWVFKLEMHPKNAVYWMYWNPYFSLVKYIQLLWFFLLNSVEYRLSQHQSVFQGKSAGVGPFQRGRRGLRFKWLAPRAACWSSRFLAHVQGAMYGAFSCVWLPYQICNIYILMCVIYKQLILRNWLLKNRQKVSGEDFPEKNGYRTDVSCPELRFGDGCEELHWWSSELHLGRAKGRHPGARCEDYGWSIEKISENGVQSDLQRFSFFGFRNTWEIPGYKRLEIMNRDPKKGQHFCNSV